MQITIINGTNDNPVYKPYEDSLLKIISQLEDNHVVNLFTPREMDLNFCSGCWNCWLKTPGECVFKDDGIDFVKAMSQTDMFIIASPVVAGFLSKEAKKLLDRLLPITLPSIRLFEGECHHKSRYAHIPISGLVLFDHQIDAEAQEILFENFDRISKNTHSNHIFKHCVTPETMEVLINEISNI